ncbi:MAG: hypothetical protein NTV52_32350, partial [Acidobacteria bacterium]|nr:hypothetical protein [Acidobacteriota bacterium]
MGLTGMGESWWLRAVQSLNHALFLAIGWAGFQAAAPKCLPAIEPGWMIIHWVNLGLAIALVLSRRSKASGVPFLPICLAIYFLSNAIGYSNPRPLTLGGVRFNNTIMGNIVFGALLVGERLYRLRRSAAETARLAGQFAAARSVQQMLLLGSVPDTPGLVIDPVCRPADEVGGDFFRILAAPGAETLLIVGDVSGQGLKAAMVVRGIVGAL